ncbi:hypothetical protein B0H15DRAFT_932031 [Mycena belliarum]|uniref:Uncharacterized protein n=1 Tax=Mycena belliarum TaxID=1033014 RepID=A0AAD6XSQ7_9AGAR|nr:hypothetical protein B0H15DRAFT_932031 [Mycena belliae]
MTFAPRTTAILYGVACACDIAGVIILSISLATRPENREWFWYLLVVSTSLLACGAAWNSYRCWKIHREQSESSTPLMHTILHSVFLDADGSRPETSFSVLPDLPGAAEASGTLTTSGSSHADQIKFQFFKTIDPI